MDRKFAIKYLESLKTPDTDEEVKNRINHAIRRVHTIGEDWAKFLAGKDIHSEESLKALLDELMSRPSRYTKIDGNPLFSYGIDDSRLHLHTNPVGNEFIEMAQNKELYRDAFIKLADIIKQRKIESEQDPTKKLVTEITMTSPVFGTIHDIINNPKLARLGANFKAVEEVYAEFGFSPIVFNRNEDGGQVIHAWMEQYFPYGTRRVGHTSSPVEKFIIAAEKEKQKPKEVQEAGAI